jgi:zinc/manganese transport system substrate-binding protein
MRKILTLTRVVAVGALGLIAVACGSDDSATTATTEAITPADSIDPVSTTEPAPATAVETTVPDGEVPTIVVTTNILGDIVSQTVGDLAEVEVLMPIGADPHDFAPSAQEAESMENADLLVVNGAGFEEGMIDIIEQVESSGTPVFTFADHISLLEFADEHSQDDGHSDDEEGRSHGDEETTEEHGGDDPHIWTDPSRLIPALEAFGTQLATLEGVDAGAVEEQVQSYVDELVALDAEMEQTLSVVPPESRVLVTNHEVFGYFTDRFGFEVVGAVIPSLTTSAEPSAAEVDALVELIQQEQVPAIFGDTSGSTRLAEAIAASAGSDVRVVVLFSESLGEPGSGAETYLDMMSTNATLIAEALAPA